MNAGESKTTDRLERALHASLKAIDPGVDFTSALQGVDALIHVASPLPGRGDPDYTIDVSSARLWLDPRIANEEHVRLPCTVQSTSLTKR